MNIALVYENLKYQNETVMLLSDAGYEVNLTYSIDSAWFAGIKDELPDVLIIAVSVPGKKLQQQLENFKQQVLCPVIVLASNAEIQITEKIILAGADSCVTGNISADRMQSLIEISRARFKVTHLRIKEIEQLNKNIDLLELRLSDRKYIEKAKGLLMSSYKMNEDDAYNALRKMAMDTGNKLGEVSRNLISMSKVLS